MTRRRLLTTLLVAAIAAPAAAQVPAVHADAAVRANAPVGAQGALVSLDRDGAVRAMVGGKDYVSSIYNRATQAQRDRSVVGLHEAKDAAVAQIGAAAVVETGQDLCATHLACFPLREASPHLGRQWLRPI